MAESSINNDKKKALEFFESYGSQTEDRKLDHLKICLERDVQGKRTTGLEDVFLVHQALPEIDFDDIILETELFGKNLQAPIICASMTGGHKATAELNRRLGVVMEKYQLGIGLGSQRAAIEDPTLIPTYSIVREVAPTTLVLGNLGAVQINANNYGLKQAEKCVEMIKADALCMHINPLQEAIQAEGDRNFKDLLPKLTEFNKELSVPIIVKEVGSGISGELAKKLELAKIEAIDVGGVGGTTWAGVEAERNRDSGAILYQNLGELFWNWGISTSASIVETRANFSNKIIATGGIRTGLDIAKSIALGANVGSLATPFLQAAAIGIETLEAMVEKLILELKTVMFVVGAKTIDELRTVPVVVSGITKDWLQQRGYHPFV